MTQAALLIAFGGGEIFFPLIFNVTDVKLGVVNASAPITHESKTSI